MNLVRLTMQRRILMKESQAKERVEVEAKKEAKNLILLREVNNPDKKMKNLISLN